MPDFLPILIIGIICFVALLLAFGGGFNFKTSMPSNYLPPDRTIEFNSFDVYYISSEEKVGYAGGQISNGIFSNEEKRIGFSVAETEDVSEIFLDVKTWDTNYYGKMIILVNGKEIYSDYTLIGERLIGFDPSILKKDNILEVKAESSGWRIWAPTLYTFDMDVVVSYLGKRTKSFTFDVDDLEIKSLEKARVVVFGDRKGTGNLDILVNGVKVHSGVTTVYKDFPTSVLKTGNNTIEFSTEANTTYEISSAQVILFF